MLVLIKSFLLLIGLVGVLLGLEGHEGELVPVLPDLYLADLTVLLEQLLYVLFGCLAYVGTLEEMLARKSFLVFISL